MLALLLTFVLSSLPTENAPCARREELREAMREASRHTQREEQLQALAFRARTERADPAQAACAPDLLRTEALVLLFLGDYVESLAVMDRLLADYPDLDADLEGRTHTNRGYALTRLGRTADAALAYAAAAERAAEVEPELGARFLMEASKTYRLLRQPEAAATYLEAAAALADLGGDASLAARVLTERALLDMASASQEGAYAADSLARAGLAHAYGALSRYDDRADTAYQSFHTYILIADLHLLIGEVAPAGHALEAAGQLLRRVESSYPAAAPQLDLIAGRLALIQGERAAAERHFQQALRSARRLSELPLQMDALRLLGDHAAGTDLQRAAGLYRQAIAVAEVERESLGLQDWSVSAFERYQRPYRHLVRTLVQMDEPEQAFAQLDAVRARYLRDLRASAALRRTLGPEQQQQLAAHHEQLRDARAQLADPALDASAHARHELAVAQVQAEIESLSGARPAPPRPLALEALQAALGRRQQHLVTYFLDDEVAVAFVVRADTFAVRTLPGGARDIQHAADALRVLWNHTDGTHRAPPLGALHRLYQLAIAPVADLLPRGEPVVIIPEGPLTDLPFAAFAEQPTGRFGYADAPFLLRRHPLSTELAASLLVESGAPARVPTEQPFVAFGRSRFEGAPQSLRAGAALGPLPFVPSELERIVAEMGEGRAFLDEAATERAFEDALAAPRLLHLATHVLPDAELPLYSHAILWDDPDAPDDGILHAYEIEGRLLDLDLVVLSGCETGRGRGRQGEGMQSLQYAFRAAGARSTVATLWQVDDRATAFVMDRFYHHLGQGARKDAALQQAQLDYLGAHDGAMASPALWAAAVLYGDPAPLGWTADRGGALGWVLLSLGLLVLAALPIAYRRRRARRSR